MSDRNVTPVVRALAATALLSATPAASSVALAQDVITLEIIGAVRMAQPDEIRRMSVEQEFSRAQSRQQHETQEATPR